MEEQEVDTGYYNLSTPTHLKHTKFTDRTHDWPQLPKTLSSGLRVSLTLQILVVLSIDLTVPLQTTTKPSLSLESILCA